MHLAGANQRGESKGSIDPLLNHIRELKRMKYIKTHGSESRGQEEAGLRDERVSYL